MQNPQISKTHAFPYLFILLLSLCLSGCDIQSDNTGSLNSQPLRLATLNDNETIDLEQLSLADQIKLYNLRFQLNELTLSATREQIEQQYQLGDAITWLPPEPITPSIQIKEQPSWTWATPTNTASSSTATYVDIACSYASRPCADIVNQLQDWMPVLKSNVEFRYYDLPQGYHRFGIETAAVVSCLSGNAKQQFTDYLWQQQGQLDMAKITGAIDLYSPNPDETYQCMSSNDTLNYVRSRIENLNKLGLSLTPTIAINGQYVSRGYELRHLFTELISTPQLTTMETESDVKWLHSWTPPNADQNWALVEYQGQVLRVTPGVKLGDYWVAGIQASGLSLVKHHQIAWISSPTTFANASTPNGLNDDLMNISPSADDTQDQLASEEDPRSEDRGNMEHKARYEALISELKAVPLPQHWLEEQLMRQEELEASLFLTEAKVEGKSLVKLNHNEIDNFYTSLGMKPGDVIMRVNDQWIHEGNNVLFQSLSNEERVTISVMRKGLPVHLAFETQP